MARKAKTPPRKPADPNASAIEAGIRQRLRDLRLARSWTAEQAAEALNANVVAYRKWEKRTNPPLWVLPRVVLIYGTSYEWLFTGRRDRLAPMFREIA